MSMQQLFRRPLHRRRTMSDGRRWRRRILRLDRLECRVLLAGDLAITEFMASNATTLEDADGDRPDWIEIHNGGTEPVDLAGWTLSDDANDLEKWAFPSRMLDPGQYLLVFASGKNRGNGTDELHTNFKLNGDGEYVALVVPAGVVVSQFGVDGTDYPEQSADISYGVPAGGGAAGYLASPTPGEPNTIARSAAVSFDRPSGLFQDAFSLTLTVNTDGATIHYTMDGNRPTADSDEYTEPLRISSTTHVQAIAVAPGQAASTPTGRWYVTVDAHLADFTSDLPILVFENFTRGDEARKPTETEYQFNAMAIFDPDPATGRSSLLDTPTLETRSGLKVRGSSSAYEGWPKPSYALETWDEQNDDRAVSLLGMPSESDWVLYGPIHYDLALLRTPFIFELSNQVGRWAPRTRLVEVYHNMDGGDVSAADYWGVYVLMEKIKIGPDRVNVQELRPEHDQEPEISGGWLLKIDRPDPGDVGFSAAQQAIYYVDPKEEDVTETQAAWIESYFNDMHAALTDWDPENGYAQYIDVDSWIDHHILNVLAVNVDALRLSGFFFKDRAGKIEMGPIWDFDRCMESNDSRDNRPNVWNGSGDATKFFEYPWWKELFEDPNFMQTWIDRWFELRRDVFSETNIESIIDSLASEIEEAQVRDFELWGIGDSDPRQLSSYMTGALNGTWEGEVAHMKEWLFDRLVWIDSQFLSPPTITPDGGRVPVGQQITLSSESAGPIYYTTDGTDPRLPGGLVDAGAILVDDGAQLVFSEPVSIMARVLEDGHWSAPASASFFVAGAADDASHLAVTEINYHPYDPTDLEQALDPGLVSRQFEFIELTNTGAHTIELSGVALVDGVEFTFGSGAMASLAPGEYVLVAADKEAFAARYGEGLPVAGQFSRGVLSDNGEHVVLVDRYGAVIQACSYADSGQWPGRADGIGSTLEVINLAGVCNEPGNWRASSEFGGSPGFAGSGPVLDVVVNEVLCRCEDGAVDHIELYNRTPHAVDLSGWYVSDTKDALQKGTLPDGTTISAGEYLVLSLSALGFGLNRTRGDEVWLVASDGSGRPLRFVDQMAFDATGEGVSLGRWPDGDPAGIFFPMQESSFGQANVGPVTGAVVISEVHYHPSSDPILVEHFSDGKADAFTPVLGTWEVRAKGYEVTPGPEEDTIATILTGGPLPKEFLLSATISARDVPEFKQNGMLVFDYHNRTDFKFVSMHPDAGRWKIGQRDESGWLFLVDMKTRYGIAVDTDVRVKVEIRGSSVMFWAGGVLVEHDFQTPLNDGQVGVASKGGTPRFEQVKLARVDYTEALEFLELANTTAAPIDLKSWRLEGGVELTFAAETTVGVGEALVVVSFDPSIEEKATFFRQMLGVDDSVVLAGPYFGELDSRGEVVRLLKPVAPDSDSYVLVDQVGYGDQSPWPTAVAAEGLALSRATVAAFGSFASSWSARAPTPGTVHDAAIGDLNFDGAVNGKDVRGFVHAVTDPLSYQAAYGVPATMVADVDGDGKVDFDDIDDFVALVCSATPTAAVRAAGGAIAEGSALGEPLAAPSNGPAEAAERIGARNTQPPPVDLSPMRSYRTGPRSGQSTSPRVQPQ